MKGGKNNMMTYAEIKNALSMLDNPVMRLDLVMDIGARMDAVPENATCNEISGCASVAMICHKDGRFYGRADSALVQGILGILLAMIDGKTIAEIKKMDIAGEFASLKLNLGAGRLNGVNSMIRFLQNL